MARRVELECGGSAARTSVLPPLVLKGSLDGTFFERVAREAFRSYQAAERGGDVRGGSSGAAVASPDGV